MRDGETPYGNLLVILAALLSIGLLSVTFRTSSLVFDSPLTEDAYYVLTVSRNIARGIGFSVDGTTLTNGFHPLWAIVTSVIFVLVGEASEPAIRILLAVSAMLAVLSAFSWSSLIGSAFDADNRLYRIVFVLVYLTSFQLLVQHFNGLETGFILVLFAIVGTYWRRSFDYRIRSSAILGMLLGILVLARIDAAIFAALIAAEVAWRLRLNLRQAFAQLAIIGGVASLIAAPWFLYNLALTGKLTPVSGLALGIASATPFSRVVNTAGAVARDGFPNIVGEINPPASLAVFVLACVFSLFLLRRQSVGSLPFVSRAPTEAEASTRRCREYLTILLAYVSVQIVAYTMSNNAAFFYPRYFILLSVAAVGMFAFLLYRLALSRLAWLIPMVAVLLTAGALTTIAGWHGAVLGDRLNRLQGYNNGPTLGQVALAKAVRLKGEKLGALQTGTLAFFVEGAINLDGRVNFAAYEARRQGKLLEYVLAQRIGLLVDYEIYLRPGNFDYFMANEDVGRYFSRIAPDRPPRDYDWVALQRSDGAPAR